MSANAVSLKSELSHCLLGEKFHHALGLDAVGHSEGRPFSAEFPSLPA